MASPLSIYNKLTPALSLESVGYTKLLAGVQWTRNGNLVFQPAAEVCTAKFLAEQYDNIWPAIRPLLKLPETYSCPAFDTDERWHSVVFHGVPVPPNRCADTFIHALVDRCVTSEISQGELNGFSVLNRPEDLQTRDVLALRVSLSSEADASCLIKHGGFMAGTWCRVSHYVKKPQTCSPTPTS
ncbi:hypothetical protein B0H19DRAFT_1309921 [Mycena capillaripes]|nr:hypothetical protein B0H19DRAFT_1309921 [Mycena capillaripes]